MTASPSPQPFWTVPNAICVGRMLGLVPLLWLAWAGHRMAFVGLMVILLLSDWLDGKLARRLDQQTEVGARLDSFADGLMYAVVAVSFWWLEGDVVRRQWPFFAGVFGCWSLSAVVGLVRFGRLPSYHTVLAKASWLVVGVTAVVWLLGEARPVPWALSFVILANLEAVAIGLVLPHWSTDVPSVFHAWRLRKGRAAAGAGPET